MSETAERKRVDWDAIEPLYRAVGMSLTALAAQAGCSKTAIIKHARAYGWTRGDVREQIRERADAKVAAEMVREVRGDTAAAPKAVTQDLRVEVEAEVQKRIRLEHRSDISRSKGLVNQLLEVLQGVAVTESPDSFDSKLPKLPLREHAQIIDRLVSVQAKIVSMEREAYGIDTAPIEPPPASVDPLESARRIAFVLARGAAQAEAQQTKPLH